jgi:Xaa-Pro aminopeptidase
LPTRLASLPERAYRTRLDAIREWLREKGYRGLLAVSGYAERDGNVCYLCGHKNAFPYSAKTAQVSGLGYSALLVPTEGSTTLIAPLGYRSNAVVGVDKSKTGTNFASELIDAIKETNLDTSKLAVAGGDVLPVIYIDEVKRVFPDLNIEYSDEILANMRAIKSEDELRLIRQASKIADKAMAVAIKSIKPGMRESAIGSVARKAAMDAGADYVVRDRVHSGSEMGHLRWPFASSKRVRRGELVSVDFVGWVKSYGFDILRIGCAGRPNKEQRRLVEVAGEATQVMSARLKDQSEIESSISALRNLEKDGFHISPFGHGIGLEIVENPYLFPGVIGKVRKNMVFCVEPDVTWKGGWASIENEIIVTNDKPEVLTKLPILQG